MTPNRMNCLQISVLLLLSLVTEYESVFTQGSVVSRTQSLK